MGDLFSISDTTSPLLRTTPHLKEKQREGVSSLHFSFVSTRTTNSFVLGSLEGYCPSKLTLQKSNEINSLFSLTHSFLRYFTRVCVCLCGKSFWVGGCLSEFVRVCGVCIKVGGYSFRPTQHVRRDAILSQGTNCLGRDAQDLRFLVRDWFWMDCCWNLNRERKKAQCLQSVASCHEFHWCVVLGMVCGIDVAHSRYGPTCLSTDWVPANLQCARLFYSNWNCDSYL